MNIYKIKKEYEEILSNPLFVDFDTGEITEAGEKALKENADAKGIKCEHIARFIKNLEGENTAYENEINRISNLKKSNNNKIKGLKKLLEFALDGQELNTELFKFSFRKSEKAELLEKDKLPERFITSEVVEKIAGLPEIKKYLKEEIQARIEEAKNDGKTYNEEDIKTDVYSENGLNITFNSNLQIK